MVQSLTPSVAQTNISWNVEWVIELRSMLKEAVMTYFQIQPRNLLEEAREIRSIPRSRQQMPRSRYEQRTSQTQVKSVTA